MFDSRLKYKWDNQNVLDTAIREAVAKIREEGRQQRLLDIKRMVGEMKKDGLPSDQISRYTKLSIEEIEKL